eukprot:jgi/Botrbrau1/8020/Bobra.384_2s0042.1
MTLKIKFHQRRPSYTLICLACFGGLGGLLFGYDTGVISGALPYIRDDILTNYATDPGRLGWIQEVIVTAAIFGAGIGSACGGLLADFLGRRFTLFISDGLFTGGALLMAFAASPPTLIFGVSSPTLHDPSFESASILIFSPCLYGDCPWSSLYAAVLRACV